MIVDTEHTYVIIMQSNITEKLHIIYLKLNCEGKDGASREVNNSESSLMAFTRKRQRYFMVWPWLTMRMRDSVQVTCSALVGY